MIKRTSSGPRLWWVTALPALLALNACAPFDADMDLEDADDAFAALEDPWGPDPCAGVSANPASVGVTKKSLADGRTLIVGTDDRDVIEGTNASDIICTFKGRDVVHGRGGDDYIDGGSGNDELYGDDGNDTIHGRGGSDDIHGGEGNDRLFGDILDDHLYGDAGNDLLIGGHGADHMDGGAGDDWMRGDTNTDDFIGGGGNDTASFATAMPPGQPQDIAGQPNPTDGVAIDFAARTASGDGYEEPLEGIERVIGSPFNDTFAHVGNRTVVSDLGNDTCDGTPCGAGKPAVRAIPFVYVAAEHFDRGVVVMGTAGNDDLLIKAVGQKVRVKARNGSKIDAGPGCSFASAAETEVECGTGGDPLRYILGWGDAGNDAFELAGDFPRDLTAHVDGGEGDDILIGGDEQDVFFTGRMGSDHLHGNGGDDALISESRKSDLDLPGNQYPGGADELDGGDGDDQLVVDYPCGGHFYRGGPGIDIAGFARAGDRGIIAQLDGKFTDPSHRQVFVGRAYSDLCAADWQTYATHMEGNLEILEGTSGDDKLFGNDANNTIWGRLGNDELYGFGGDDILWGLEGNDVIRGGTGRDVMKGGDGYDHIYASDGEADIEISCGDGGGVLESHDGKDPLATTCKIVSGGGNGGGGNSGGGNSGGGNSGGGGGGSTGTPGCGGDDFALPGQSTTHCYRVITARTWDQARAQCQDVNMHLATLTLPENTALKQSGRVGTATWIGGHRQGATKQFYWVKDDEAFPGSAPWNDPAEASSTTGDKCVTYLADATWGLKSCDVAVQALCEDF